MKNVTIKPIPPQEGGAPPIGQAYETQAQLVIAKQFPRDTLASIEAIKNACTRHGLAEVALYSYVRGGVDITLPSIRLAEVLAQNWGNMDFGFREILRGKDGNGVGYSDIQAFCWDMQSNTRRAISFCVPHRRDTKKGGYELTAERDIYELTASMAQRRVRACILSVVPHDVTKEAVEQCAATLHAQADTSAQAVKKMVDTFSDIGVRRLHLEKFIQRKMDAITPAQIIRLRKIYTSIHDGMSDASDWFDSTLKQAKAEAPVDPFKAENNSLATEGDSTEIKEDLF
jgi:hypothetical protein